MPPLECAVVGGGVAGLYAAWRLTSSGAGFDPSSLAVFEAQSRLGGRIDTVPVGNSSSSVELGAMRFWHAQELVTGLLAQMQLGTEPFPGQQEIGIYLRGVLLRPPHFAQPANVPFRLEGAEVGQDVAGLLGYALSRIAPEVLGPVTTAQLDVLVERRDLASTGFWNALEGVLSSEAYQLLQGGMGERTALSNWHAGEAVRLMALIVAALRGGLFRPVKGFSSLIAALQQALDARGVRIATSRRLLTIAPGTGGADGLLELTFARDGSRETERCLARKVILALPKTALSDLVQRSHVALGDLARIETLLDSVSVFAAFKLYASYATPWWIPGWSASGYSVTDLPIRQVYYGAGVGGSDADNKRVLLACYADGGTSEFWGPLARVSTPPGPAPVVSQVVRQLGDLHSMRGLPEPEWWTCRDWGAEGGAWHGWKPGQSVPDTMRRLRQPWPELPMFVCGEAFSRMQGWIEGALTSTERTLQDAPFGLPRPDWISADYDLGP